MLDSLRKNRDLITLLSPRQSDVVGPSSLLSPNKVQAKHSLADRSKRGGSPQLHERNGGEFLAGSSPKQKEMGVTFGGDLEVNTDNTLGAGLKMPKKLKNVKDPIGKSLVDGLLPGDAKKLKKTRFSLNDAKMEMPNDVME